MLGLGLLLLVLLAGCASTDEMHDERTGETEAPSLRPTLAPTDTTVHTIQLYQGNDERALPIISVNASNQLTLAFDILTEDGRPLSVYFFHADRSWQRDLSPSQYMEGFIDDAVLDYRPSRGTDVPYVHYRYQFPNDTIGFTVSGNYIVRVTEQGRRNDVLFERAFYVTEQRASGQIDIEGLRRPGQPLPLQQPSLLFTPPADLRGNPFGYTVCFARNGLREAPRCSERPLLSEQPALAFELDREDAYAPTTAPNVVDLSSLRTSRSIAHVDRTRRPPRIEIEPDDARFLGEDRFDPLDGQTLVRAALRQLSDPEVSAQYVDVQFTLRPPEPAASRRDVFLTGPFLHSDEGLRMSWDATTASYVATARMKQGMHEYSYRSTDPDLQSLLQEQLMRRENRYITFVYYRDASLGTDRLLHVQTARSRF